MNFLHQIILILILPLKIFASDSALGFCKFHLPDLKLAMNQRIQMRVTPASSDFLIELYKNAGLNITADDIKFKGLSEHMMGVSLDFEVKNQQSLTVYNSLLWNAFDQSVLIRRATDNAIWDSLGNLVKPATEVTCIAERSFRQDLGIFNKNTGKSVGTIDAPADEVGNVSFFLIEQKFLIP